MDIADQYLILRLWQEYVGDRVASNSIVREFYLDIIKPSDLYFYGVAYEVFDILTNGVFDLGAAGSWNGRGTKEQGLAKQAMGETARHVQISDNPVAAA